MLRDLVTALPALHACFAEAGIADLVYPKPVFSEAARGAQQQVLNATDIAQPALGMVSLAAFEVLASYGLRPDFLAGHSYGEYTALCAGGAITRDELLRLSMTRGRLCAAAPAGAMAALDRDGASVAAAIARHGLAVSIANLNAPDQTVIAGTVDAIEAARGPLIGDGMRFRRLAVGAAFHCDHMAGVGEALRAELATVGFSEPRVPVYSNLTAAPYPSGGAQMGELLMRHIAEPVRFADEIEALYAAGARVFVECGPGLTLTGLVGRVLGQRPYTVLAIDAPERNGWVQLAQLLSNAMAAGLPVNLEAWFAGRGLAPQSLDDLFACARTEPGPLVWRVNGGRAAPWKTTRAAPVRQAPPAASVAPPRPPPMPLIPSPAPIHHWRTTMNPESESIPDDFQHLASETVAGPASATEFMQIEQSLACLLAFQSEQQQTLHRFFDFHAGMAGIARTAPAAPMTTLMRPPPPRAVRTLAPSPVLPGPALGARPALPARPVRIPLLPELPGNSAPAAAPEAPAAQPIHAKGAAIALAAVAQPASEAEFSAELLRAVSERTGYPVEMLDMDAHMEADLGIDSIKRIEIFSGLTQRHSLVGERDEETMIEELSGFKTLREVVAWYARLLEPPDALPAGGVLPKKASTPLSRPDEEVESRDSLAQGDPVQCYVVQTRAAPLGDDDRRHAGGAGGDSGRFPVVLVGKPSALAEALRVQLTQRGHLVRQLVPGVFTRVVDDWRYEVDLASADSLAPLADLFPADPAPVGVLINLMGWDGGQGGTASDHFRDSRALFLLLKFFGPQLKRSAGRLLNLTAFDGKFGLAAPGRLPVAGAGTLGVAKSAAREWGELRVKCIDAAPGLDPSWLASQMVAEMFGDDLEVEVGYSADGRCRIDMAPRSLDVELGALQLGPEPVVLVTGGAYGITADLTRVLAEKYRPRLVLVGRSALPGDESAVTGGIDDKAELRRLLTAHLQAGGQRATPVLVEAALAGLFKEREIRANLAALRAAGCQLEYHSIDVRDRRAFEALIDDVYLRLGRIDGVLHGAGIISDKLIANKPLDAFDAVFDTKVVPALVLASKLRLDEVRFIVFFSSVAGRFGNIGQADYSAANEVLNKLAGRLGHAHPGLHALAINWGPWDAGMVSDDLRRLYAARGIEPIAPAAGRRHFLDALERGPGKSEIVISSSIGQIAALRLGSRNRLQTS
jgi:malonyl CoA-acyl carrier protein transacylase